MVVVQVLSSPLAVAANPSIVPLTARASANRSARRKERGCKTSHTLFKNPRLYMFAGTATLELHFVPVWSGSTDGNKVSGKTTKG